MGENNTANLYRSGHFRLLIEKLHDALEANPDDPTLHCQIGVAYARAGRFADALPELEVGIGSELYEREGLGAHADTLRALGRGEEAAAMRRERLVMAANDDAETLTWLALVDDYRSVGDLDAARDAGLAALSLMPRGALVLSSLADVAMDGGDLAEAGDLLWVAASQGDGPPAVRLSHVRLALLEGDVEEATTSLEAMRPRAKRIWQASVLDAEMLRRDGDPAGAAGAVEARYLVGWEYPALLAERVLIADDLGDFSEAASVLGRAVEVYPTDPDVLVAERYHKAAVAHQAANAPAKSGLQRKL